MIQNIVRSAILPALFAAAAFGQSATATLEGDVRARQSELALKVIF